MKNFKRCIPCAGSGKLLGGGCVIVDCDNCDGRGKIEVIEDDIELLKLKESTEYKKVYDEELTKLKKEKRKLKEVK